MQPEIDYSRVGHRIRMARLTHGLSQAELGALVGCSNNHMSHIETGQTKVSLTMLLRISNALEYDIDYFLLDTPYTKKTSIINSEIARKLDMCNAITLVTVNKILDILIEQQETSATSEY